MLQAKFTDGKVLRVKVWWEIGFLHNLNVTTIQYLSIQKKKVVTLLPGRYQLNQVVKVNITTNNMYWHYVPSKMMHWEHSVTSVFFLVKIHNSNLFIRKKSEKPIWATFFKMTTDTYQRGQCHKRQGETEEML